MFGFLEFTQVHSFMLGLHQPYTYTNVSRNGNSTEAKLNIKYETFSFFSLARVNETREARNSFRHVRRSLR